MAWKNVQYENGKLRTSSGGSGGASNFADLEDVDLNNLQDGQIIKWDATNEKFVNADESGGGHTYSTTEQVIGTWIDGKPLYEKSIVLSSSLTIQSGGWQYVFDIPNVKNIIYAELNRNSLMSFTIMAVVDSTQAHNIGLQTTVSSLNCDVGSTITLRYTKTTD